jgi:hypothetical protein
LQNKKNVFKKKSANALAAGACARLAFEARDGQRTSPRARARQKKMPPKLRVKTRFFNEDGFGFEAFGFEAFRYNFCHDMDVLRAVYDAVNERRFGGLKFTESSLRRLGIARFDEYDFLTVMTRIEPTRNGTVRKTLMFLTRGGDEKVNWSCRFDDQWRLLSVYPLAKIDAPWIAPPLLNPARVKFQSIVRWICRVRPFAWHWLEAYQKASCAPGGGGRKRDREAFESEF